MVFLWCVLYSISLSAQTPIDTTEILTIGGIKQFVNIKGKDRAKPLFLFLHGGPGNSVMSYAEKFTYKLQEHFVVVQWDQRESGKTKELNSLSTPLTVDLFKKDTEALVAILLDQFHQPKLYLAGHSWGTVLGFHMAKVHPELLHAYIAISPMINQLESERIILERMKEKARQNSNQQELKELNTIKVPFENGAQLYYHRKWLFHYVGAKTRVTKSYVESWAATWLKVFNEASADNLMTSTPSLECPVFFFLGRNDYQTNAGVAEKYYQQLIAPKKELFWFERSAHSVPSTEPELLQRIIIENILSQNN